MKTIDRAWTIEAPLEKVWQALINPELIEQWSGSKAVMSEREGGLFELWGGDIHGKNKTVEVKNKLVQDWKLQEWDKMTEVTIELTEENGETTVRLVHKDIPAKSYESIDKGWNDYYFGAIKKLLEE